MRNASPAAETGFRQYATLDISTYSGYIVVMMTTEEITERMKQEVLADVTGGRVPATVGNYAALHDYTDANCYGNAELLFDEMHGAAPDTEEGHTLAWNSFCDVMNPAIAAVDAWIRSGGITGAMAGKVSR